MSDDVVEAEAIAILRQMMEWGGARGNYDARLYHDAKQRAEALLGSRPTDPMTSNEAVSVSERATDWTADDNIGVIYRKRAPTIADYDEAITALQMARDAIASGDESRGCAVCTDSGHGVRTCHHNPLVAAREWVVERGKHRCYHCGFVALTDEQAQSHFGRCEDEVAKCIREQTLSTPPAAGQSDSGLVEEYPSQADRDKAGQLWRDMGNGEVEQGAGEALERISWFFFEHRRDSGVAVTEPFPRDTQADLPITGDQQGALVEAVEVAAVDFLAANLKAASGSVTQDYGEVVGDNFQMMTMCPDPARLADAINLLPAIAAALKETGNV